MAQTLSPISVGTLFAYADRQITQSARRLWPRADVEFGAHTPSVTGYVRAVEVDGIPMVAKYSILGLSLVSVVRGTCGSWQAVTAAQDAYAAGVGSLLEREAEQLRLLRWAGLGAPDVAGFEGGVLFTRPVPGPTLGELIAKEPQRTNGLCARVLRELGLGLRRIGARAEGVAIAERSIPATFTRKFNGVSGRTYLAQAGHHASALTAVVSRLQRLRLAPTAEVRPVVYGDLKPEHVHFPDGPDGAPVFLDPGIARGRPQADHTKLISRLILGLFATPPSPAALHIITAEIRALTQHATAALGKAERTAWLRELLVLWLMDTINILTTYLTCPLVLPMPLHAVTLVEKTPALLGLLDQTSADLAGGVYPGTVWETALVRLSTAVGP
ncbi:hypothetical protein [Streptomyces sp. NPDC056682]|uniref:hypothetical protein n=1 Tax=Streptomyces sp. NPDC056682 TaxID=3345909 RepID=UPI0036D0FE15